MDKKEELFYPSEDNKTKIHTVRWIPEKEVKAVLQIAHGMAEFVGRYEEFAQYLSSQGILVTGNDHLGHGDSILTENDLGYFAEKDGNQTVLKDMHKLTMNTKEKYPDIPYFLLGHSMGSFLTRQYLFQYGNELDGAIIMGTGNQPQLIIKSGILITKIIALFKGWNHRSKFVDNMLVGGNNKKFEPARTTKDWLSKDAKIVDAYIANKKCGFVFTLNADYNMLLGMSTLGNKKLLDKMSRDLPVLFVSGENDPVGTFGKGVLQVVEQFRSLGMKSVKYKLYPQDRHEILNELDREIVYQDIYQWLNSILVDHK